MANHKSALKRIRQTESRTERNRDRISRIKTFIKKFANSIGKDDMLSAFSSAQSEIQKGVSKGVLQRNTASRKISRLSKLLRASTSSK
jgi:small subunit ribosomal protein S20